MTESDYTIPISLGIIVIVSSILVIYYPSYELTSNITLSTNIPDSDPTDGYYETQYGYWALLDKDQNLLEYGNPVQVYGTYEPDFNISVRKNIGNFSLIYAITQIDSYYDFMNNEWIHGTEQIIEFEVIKYEISSDDKKIIGDLNVR